MALADLRPDVVGTEAIAGALDRGVGALFDRQHDDGWWKGELETNVCIEAEDLFLRQFLGIRTEPLTRATANWIRSKQRDDGTWATFAGGPGEISCSVEAYWALKLAGDPADADHMRRAAAFIRDEGGLERARVFTRLWMALFGLWSWDDLPALPPEVILLPTWAPLNIYDFACWARQTIVPLTIVGSHRPVRPMGVTLDELRTGSTPGEREPQPWTTTAGRFQRLDRVLHRYERHPIGPLRRHALRRAEQWIIQRQEADGSWGGIQPPWVYSILALNLQGYPVDHPIVAKGLAAFDDFTVVEPDADIRRLECCQSPVWDTALAVIALADAGVPADDPRLVRAADWLLDEEVRVAGDWAVKRPGLEPGGWAFEFENDNYPDIDDTAEVVMALDRVAHPQAERVEAAIERAVRWTNGMQSTDGGYGAFDADNTSPLPAELPFCDFGKVTDPPTADVTAHLVEMLGVLDESGRTDLVDPHVLAGALDWLSDNQEDDGSWFGRWGANHLYGTGAAVPALIAAGVPVEDDRVVSATAWLEAHQNADGGWGEDLRSYRDRSWVGRGESTASQTAWALLALLAARNLGPATRRGIAWLVENQRADGSWDEPQFTGTGFPRDFYINYHLYRLTFPVTALGRYLAAIRPEGEP